jgi:hypothetical protein
VDKKITNSKNQDAKQHPKDAANAEWVLDNFKVLKSKQIRYLFNGALFSTLLAVSFFIADTLYTKAKIEALYVSGGVTLIFYLLFSVDVFEKFQKAIKELWGQNILRQLDENSLETENSLPEEALLKFLQDTRFYFDSRLSIFFGLGGLCISVWLIWLFDQNWILRISELLNSMPAILLLGIFIRITFVFTCFVSGIIAWKTLTVGRRIYALGKQFRLDVKTSHPDGCGGLSPIGDLCLKLVYCTAPFLILIGTWLIFTNTLDVGYLHMHSSNVSSLNSTLQVLLLPFIISSFLIFFFPIISIHNAMVRNKSRFETQLYGVSQKIHSSEIELLTQADNLPNERRIILEENIDFLKRLHSRLQSIPTYPFRISHLFRLTSSQIIPIIGVVTSLISFIKDLVK